MWNEIFLLWFANFLNGNRTRSYFCVNEYNPNPEKFIIVDEVSMLDTVVTMSLLKGIKRDVKLILVGDYYQLPSVGQGQVLKDLIDTDIIDIVKKINPKSKINTHDLCA